MGRMTRPIRIGNKVHGDVDQAATAMQTDPAILREWIRHGKTPAGLRVVWLCGEPVMAGRVRPPDEFAIPDRGDLAGAERPVCVRGIDYASAEMADGHLGLEAGEAESMIRAGDGRAWLLPTPYRGPELVGPNTPRPVIYRGEAYSGIAAAADGAEVSKTAVKASLKGKQATDCRYVDTSCPWGWD